MKKLMAAVLAAILASLFADTWTDANVIEWTYPITDGEATIGLDGTTA